MCITNHSLQNKTASRTDPDAIFVSLELSRSRWLVTASELAPFWRTR